MQCVDVFCSCGQHASLISSCGKEGVGGGEGGSTPLYNAISYKYRSLNSCFSICSICTVVFVIVHSTPKSNESGGI